jgi:hypothetical protein
MNAHKKLRELGFKKTNFYKPGYDPETYESCMLLDEYETKWKTVNGKSVSVKVNKIHPKSDSFWVLKYNENYILWCYVKSHQIDKIWIENKLGKSRSKSRLLYYGVGSDDDRLKMVFDYNNRESNPLQGKNQIMNLLPKEVKRDFLLEQLFGF